MDKIHFNNANEVRAFLKDKGFTERVKIRWSNNPFGGDGFFNVELAQIPKGVATFSTSGSDIDYAFSSSDNGVTAAKLTQLRQLLKGTRAACTG